MVREGTLLLHVSTGEWVLFLTVSLRRGTKPSTPRLQPFRPMLTILCHPCQLIASNRIMDATGRLFEGLSKKIGSIERSGMIADSETAAATTRRYTPS